MTGQHWLSLCAESPKVSLNPLTLPFCVAERNEASAESSDHNATSFSEVDKRVKRRLLMGDYNAPVPQGRVATRGCCSRPANPTHSSEDLSKL